jgi:hypothetical protein
MWGDGQLTREINEELYGIARWFAYGGALHNFYMLTGGNSYGRQAALGMTTGYAPDAAIDNLLLKSTKYSAFAAFFRALTAVAPELLSSSTLPKAVQFPHTFHPDPNAGNDINHTFPLGAEYHEFGTVAFLSNYGCNNSKYAENGWSECSSSTSREVEYREKRYYLPNRTVVLVNTTTGEALFNTSDPLMHAADAQGTAAVGRGVQVQGDTVVAAVHAGRIEVARVHPVASAIEVYQESPGAGLHVSRSLVGPAEQVRLTEAVSSYGLLTSAVAAEGMPG